jgi:hypothetical protein
MRSSRHVIVLRNSTNRGNHSDVWREAAGFEMLTNTVQHGFLLPDGVWLVDSPDAYEMLCST